jgi:pyruvate-ferredoxin/flavodoxin oxidoreductase
MEKINKIANTNYSPFNYYGSKNAKKVIVAMGSVTETIKEVIDDLDEELGLIIVRLYRPFSLKYFMNVLPISVEKIAVLDRTKEFGASCPLYLDVCSILKDTNIKVVGGRYGLSSKNTTPCQIKAVYDMLDNPKDNFTIGIIDDVTNLSLNLTDYKIKNSSEMLIYGYGSDGMVSASKSLIKIIGNNTDKYVQCYNQYDSKKSGGVTKCHLRFSDNKIHSTYYVENPSLIAVSKDTYMNTFDILNDIEENGIFLLNTVKTEKEILSYLSNSDKNIIKNKNIKFYIINAYELARKVGLGNKISTILESCIIYLSNIINYDKAISDLKTEVTKRFGLKSPEIVKANIDAIDNFKDYLKLVKDIEAYDYIERPKYIDVYDSIVHRKGDELPVSAFLNMPDGTFPSATSKLEKRMISDIVPCWISSNCIKCNMCSFVCPHGVIRPFKLSDEEINNAPDFIKERVVDNYIIGISVKDCTGCGLCIKSCMAKQKALISSKLVDNIKTQDVFDYLVNNISYKKEVINNVKNSQFKMPKIEFSGACAGCGQPAYIKLLTQLFGDSMVIANATGCSSIYGSSVPSMPYSIPWGSSLFEDNAEYGFGYLLADKIYKEKIVNIMSKYGDTFKEYIDNINNYEITKKVYDSIDFNKYKKLLPYKDYIVKRSIWTIGGDGWAYDIGFSGIDHVLASGENAKILVLDTQVYSNTGGQASKATPKGSVALFASGGKKTDKKDLARMMMSYPNVYVAQVSLAANPLQLIKTLKEANEYEGPAIVIAYSPCISHGIKGGMINSLDMEIEAVKCGYFPIFRRNPKTGFSLDCNPNFDLYEEFLDKQTRYTVLSKINDNSEYLLNSNKQEAMQRFEFYKNIKRGE